MGILVTGGAGYIGSHCVRQLLEQGRQNVVVFDNLSTGHRDFVRTARFVEGDIRDTEFLAQTMRQYGIETVMHFAASAYVGESVSDPAKYYDNNVYGSLRLLNAMRDCGVNKLIFSSSCAVYGVPQRLPLEESHPLAPVNPYGFTKRVVEEMLKDFAHAYDLRYVSLRYFNAAGAAPDGAMGEWHEPETHLIPLILKAISGQIPHISVLGTDYDTPDGTCIRDYIHILDIAQAHALGLDYLDAGGASVSLNIGTETGYSVREVIEACERVTGQKAPVVEAPRREGDPPALVAGADRIRSVLGWQPEYRELDDIIKTAWNWEQTWLKNHQALSR